MSGQPHPSMCNTTSDPIPSLTSFKEHTANRIITTALRAGEDAANCSNGSAHS
jgi:hypothetical protein